MNSDWIRESFKKDEPVQPIEHFALAAPGTSLPEIYNWLKEILNLITQEDQESINKSKQYKDDLQISSILIDPEKKDKELYDLANIRFYCQLQVDKAKICLLKATYLGVNEERKTYSYKYKCAKNHWRHMACLASKLIFDHVETFYSHQIMLDDYAIIYLPDDHIGLALRNDADKMEIMEQS